VTRPCRPGQRVNLLGVTFQPSGGEVDPREAGLPYEAPARIWRAAQHLYATGTQPAMTLCIRRRGQVVLNRALGFAREGVPATPDTPFCVFSVSKAVTAMLIHLLDGRNQLRIDDRVAFYIPEFAKRGKERMTIRHVLTHRAGIPSLAGNDDIDLLADWDRIIGLLCETKPVWAPGRRLAYHAITGGYILGEIVRRVTGKDIRTFLREEVSDRLGFEWFGYGVRPEQVSQVAQNRFTGSPVPPALSLVVKRSLGVPFERAVEVSNDARYLTAIVPSGNVVATADELSAFFEVLLEGGQYGGVRIFDPRTVQRALTESSYLEVDLTLGLPVRYGLGVMLGADHLSMFGPHTPQAFGHYGFINVIGWADPQRKLSAALLTSGKPFLGPHLVHLWQLLAAIANSCPAVHT
jgi:CubicO group peptidase (beta-lactamase class C family)